MTNEKNESILVINTGSSSIKFKLFANQTHLRLLAKGKLSNINTQPLFTASLITQNTDQAQNFEKKLPAEYTHKQALEYILNWINEQKLHISTVTHRVVHGGEYFTTSVRITPEILTQLQTLCPLAPLHQPNNLLAIELLAKMKPEITQVACFDTAFHSNHQRLFTECALPQTIRDKGIRRYGFHGLSYEWIAHTLHQNEPKLLEGRIIAAHLGNGASLCAMNNGVSIDTTMGMTALDGLPMGTRCGSIDPGVIIYLIRELGLSPNDVESMLYEESGLKGLSNWTNDVRLLQESCQPEAKFALNYFCMKAAQFISMMAVSLGGIDAIVFTGGIGENSLPVRQTILRHLEFIRPFEIRTIKANEEKMMALHTVKILSE